MDILSYLLELLQKSKEVGITGLGTFYKKKYPGKYDKEKQSFLPPGYSLQFTIEMKNGNEFEIFISTKRNISTDSAKYYISQFVDEVNEKLALVHEAELENIGRLFYTEHEGLTFEPTNNINYGSEFYGLPVLKEINPEIDLSSIAKNNEESAEASPISSHIKKVQETEQTHPVIENIELDEVNDDLKNTLKHTEISVLDESIKETPVPESVIEQHEEHPNRFGHTPESEEIAKTINEQYAVPESVIEQHEEHPNRFGHTPESEEPKTYINLDDGISTNEVINEAPEFIKEQHSAHPNRFGHDPILNENIEEESKSILPKVVIGILILLVIGAVIYFVKPDLFNQPAEVTSKASVIIDSPAVKIDTTKAKQDSIAKTDSILKVNQVQKKVDPIKKEVLPAAKNINVPSKTGIVTYEVIGASFRTTKKAEQFVQQMKGYGISAKIVPIEGPYKKVSIASFKTEKEAIDARPVLSKKVRIKELDIKQINTP